MYIQKEKEIIQISIVLIRELILLPAIYTLESLETVSATRKFQGIPTLQNYVRASSPKSIAFSVQS